MADLTSPAMAAFDAHAVTFHTPSFHSRLAAPGQCGWISFNLGPL